MDPQIYLDASHTALSNAQTGIQAVVRGLIAGLGMQKCAIHPVRWSFKRQCLSPLRPVWEKNLGLPGEGSEWLPPRTLIFPRRWPTWQMARGLNYKCPLHRHPTYEKCLKNQWLILPELTEGHDVRLRIEYARQHGLRVAGIFYDAIPWLHPEMVRHWSRQQHAEYMMAFAELDAVIPISQQSAQDYSGFMESRGGSRAPVRACSLAAEISSQRRETRLKENAGDPVKILCVSTLEPRKNHARLISAFQMAGSRLDGMKLELHLVGAPYGSAPDIAGEVRAITRKNPAIFWHENVQTAELRDFYRDCDFTVFGSWIEGFGLPVMESLWFGQPCLCSDQGVMAENAEGGGCLTVDVQNVNALADGMVKLAGQPDLRRKLGEQALRRQLKTWDDYAGEILTILKEI